MADTDSLVLGGIIELLGGGVASVIPQAAGAFYRLGTGFDLSAPQLTTEQVNGLLLDGEVVTGVRASNRTPTIPVVIAVPSTGSQQADRATLAGARELLLQTVSQDNWEMTWTRDGAQPLIFDCMALATVVVHYSVRIEQNLFSLVDITFEAFPYGRSDTQETIQFNSPAQQFGAPPSTVTLDDFSTAANFLTGQNTTFDTTIGNWAASGNCTVAWTNSQAHSPPGSMFYTASAAGAMQAASCLAALVADSAGTGVTGLGLKCNPGDTITGRAWFRAGTVGRSCNVGADFYDSSGNVVGSTLRGGNVSDVTTGWVQATCAVTAPSGAAYARLNAQVLAAAGSGEIHWLDDAYLDRGAVASANDPYQWSRSGTSAFGSFSARWARKWHDYPVYDRVLPAALDITSRTKFGFWFGLGTSSSQWPVWHRGTVSFSVTLYDAAGNTLSFGFKRPCHASAIESSPHWQFVSANIPQMASGFDYTTISRYVLSAWSQNQPIINPDTGLFGQQVLQSGAFFNLVQASATTTGTPGARGAWYYMPGIIGTARAPLAIQAAPGPSSFSTVTEFTTAGTQNWTAPAGVTRVDKAEMWGAGGGGAGSGSGTGGGGGGGGGEYAMELNVPVTPATVYHPVIGAAGANGTVGNQGGNGGDSTFAGDSGSTVRAHGGRGGWQSASWGGGKGGTGSSNYGHYDGGSGAQQNVDNNGLRGGGGGGSGGGSSGGQSVSDRSGASAVFDGGPGGDGGYTVSGSPPQGSAPTKGPGGGGGGGAKLGSGYNGAAGSAGKARLTYGASGLLPLQSLIVHAPPRGAPDLYNPLCPVGSGADTPNGLTEYLIPDLGNLNARYDGTYTMYLVASSFTTPSSSRDLTVQLRQYPYSGGTAVTLPVVRKGLTPSTDLLGTQTIVDMGPVTLPLADLPPGSQSPYFAATVTSTLTADRFLDILLIDTQGSFVLVNIGSSTIYNNIWLDQPDATRDLGMILGSNADRDQASSILQYAERFSGGPLAVYPDSNNRLFVYSAQGAPGLTAYYPPQWWTERLV